MRHQLTFRIALLLSANVLPQLAHADEPAINIQNRVDAFYGDGHAETSLLELESLGTTGKAKIQPWSGSYLPMAIGGAGWTYNNTRIGMSEFFRDNLRDFMWRMNQVRRKVNGPGLSEKDLEDLSPTEKYDLYLGDRQFSLTSAMWTASFELDLKNGGAIGFWEGLCHGWAAASAYSPRPSKKITVPSLDGEYLIPFFPADLKALSTLLWANSLIQDHTIFEGARCDYEYPDRDPSTGKVTTPECKGVNPGVFHLSLLNLTGKKQLSFILDKSNDHEIWNQSVRSYRFHYYNIRTGRFGSLSQSVVPASSSDYSGASDHLRDFRGSGTHYLVGVDMIVDYLDDTKPDRAETDSAKNDVVLKMHMRYDLELDADFRVLGGEWVDADKKHSTSGEAIPRYPAFMWRFRTDSPYAASIMDAVTPEPENADFKPGILVPLSKKAADFRYIHYKKEGERVELRPQPLAKVVNHLLKLSHVDE